MFSIHVYLLYLFFFYRNECFSAALLHEEITRTLNSSVSLASSNRKDIMELNTFSFPGPSSGPAQ